MTPYRTRKPVGRKMKLGKINIPKNGFGEPKQPDKKCTGNEEVTMDSVSLLNWVAFVES